MNLWGGTPMHTGACRGHRSTRSAISKVPSTLVFATGSLIWPGTRWLRWTVWLARPGNLPFSASLELGLQAYATASGFFFFFNVHSVDQTQILSGKHFISWAISAALPRLLRCYIRDSRLQSLNKSLLPDTYSFVTSVSPWLPNSPWIWRHFWLELGAVVRKEPKLKLSPQTRGIPVEKGIHGGAVS